LIKFSFRELAARRKAAPVGLSERGLDGLLVFCRGSIYSRVLSARPLESIVV
jgi:hypothetical protein